MSVSKWDGNFALLEAREINVDPKYQRDQKWDLINAIAERPIWAAFGVVCCSKRTHAGDTMWALDGQQRLNGVMIADPQAKVPVFWWPVASPKEEAALFDIINTNRKSVAALEKFKARRTAENPIYLAIARATEGAGFSLGTSPDAHTIAAVGGLETIYNIVGEDGVGVALTAYREAWPDENAPTSSMLVLLGDVMGDMAANGGLTVEKLSRAMSRTMPVRLLRRAEAIRYKQGGSKRAALRKAFKELAKL